MKNNETNITFDSKEDYSAHKRLALNLEYNLDDHGAFVREAHIGKRAAKKQTKLNKRLLNEHMSSVKKAYKVGRVALETAHHEALAEDAERTYQKEADTQLDSMFNDLSGSLLEAKDAAEYETMPVLDKLKFIRNFALDPENKPALPHIQVDENNAVLISANSLQYEHLLSLGMDVVVAEPITIKINEPKDDLIQVDFFLRKKPNSTEESQKLSTENDRLGVKESERLNKLDDRNRSFYKLATKQTINAGPTESETGVEILFKIVAGKESGASALRWDAINGLLPAGSRLISRADRSEINPALVGYTDVKSVGEARINDMCDSMLYGGVSFL